jgi:hypothetical protein
MERLMSQWRECGKVMHGDLVDHHHHVEEEREDGMELVG